MADKPNQVCKKIVWKLDETKEELEAFTFGKKIRSPMTEIMFGDNMTKWYLSFRPRGSKEGHKDVVGFFLFLGEAGSTAFKTKYTLGVIGKKGNKERYFEYPGKLFGHGYGTASMLKQDELFNLDRGYFTDGKLTLYCKLTLSDDVTEPDGQALLKQSVPNDYKRLLAEELFADFEVETSDEKILKAHKGILAARSPYFYGMLTSALKGTETNVVKVPEKAVIMKAVLSFIYCGEVENFKAIARELVFAAQKYRLDGLKALCIERIAKTLTSKNAVETLLSAEGLTDSEELKEKCIDVIASNFEYLSTTADWEDIPLSLVPDIIRHATSEVNDTINI